MKGVVDMEDLTTSEIQDARNWAEQLDKSAKSWKRMRWFLIVLTVVFFGATYGILYQYQQLAMNFTDRLLEPPSPRSLHSVDHLILLIQLRYEIMSSIFIGGMAAMSVTILGNTIKRWNKHKKDRLLARLIRNHLPPQETNGDCR